MNGFPGPRVTSGIISLEFLHKICRTFGKVCLMDHESSTLIYSATVSISVQAPTMGNSHSDYCQLSYMSSTHFSDIGLASLFLSNHKHLIKIPRTHPRKNPLCGHIIAERPSPLLMVKTPLKYGPSPNLQNRESSFLPSLLSA